MSRARARALSSMLSLRSDRRSVGALRRWTQQQQQQQCLPCFGPQPAHVPGAPRKQLMHKIAHIDVPEAGLLCILVPCRMACRRIPYSA